MEALLPLAVLAGASGSLLQAKSKQKKQGFIDVLPSVQDALGSEHNEFVQRGAERQNPIANLTNPLKNPLLPEGSSAWDVARVNRDLRNAVTTADASARNPSQDIRPSDTSAISLNPGGGANQLIKKCEAVKTIDCNAFNNKEFADNCGICHEEGRNSAGNATTGGLFIYQDDKDAANAEANRSRFQKNAPQQTPSVGTCKPGRFTTTKEQCETMKKKMECEMKQNFDVEGCSQCYQDGVFKQLPNGLETIGVNLVIKGKGQLKVDYPKDKQQNYLVKDLQNDQGGIFRAQIPAKEGDTIQITLEGQDANLQGYLASPGGSDDKPVFPLDLLRLITNDTESGGRPAVAGFQILNGVSVAVLRPARGKSVARQTLTVPQQNQSFQEQEAYKQCPGSPYITKKTSAELLDSSPCQTKGSGPGKYNQECLQQTWLGAGCDTAGNGFPGDDGAAQRLMTGPNGELLDIGRIAGVVQDASQQSWSGSANGQDLSIPDWDRISRYCTGKPRTGPCDSDDKGNGPLSQKCLQFLQNNGGAQPGITGGVGPTYTNKFATSSEFANGANRYCTENGNASPSRSDGLELSRRLGGVEAVKNYQNRIHYIANDNSLSDDQRRAAIQQCQGTALVEARPPPTQTLGQSSCSPQLKVSSTSATKNWGNIDVKTNWIQEFSVTPTGKDPWWASLFHITTGGNWAGAGSRTPGVWFWPNTTRLHVSVIQPDNSNDNLNPEPELPLGQTTNIRIEWYQGTMTIRYSGALTGVWSQKFSFMATGVHQLWATDPWQPPLKGTLSNLSFCTFDGKMGSLLDNPQGRVN